jgi:hypothetical protein
MSLNRKKALVHLIEISDFMNDIEFKAVLNKINKTYPKNHAKTRI